MIVRIPGLTDLRKRHDKDYYVSKELVELVDIFPTLAELAGLKEVPQCEKPSKEICLCTEGSSLVPLIENTVMGSKFTKVYAILIVGWILISASRFDCF